MHNLGGGGVGGTNRMYYGEFENREWYPILDKNPLNFFISYRFKILSFTVVHNYVAIVLSPGYER